MTPQAAKHEKSAARSPHAPAEHATHAIEWQAEAALRLMYSRHSPASPGERLGRAHTKCFGSAGLEASRCRAKARRYVSRQDGGGTVDMHPASRCRAKARRYISRRDGGASVDVHPAFLQSWKSRPDESGRYPDGLRLAGSDVLRETLFDQIRTLGRKAGYGLFEFRKLAQVQSDQ